MRGEEQDPILDDLPFDLDEGPTQRAARPVPATEWDDEDVTNVSAAPRPRPGTPLDASAIAPSPGSANAYLMHLIQDGEDIAHIIAPDMVLVRIGRGRDNEIQVASDGEISRRHCCILRQRDEFFVEDLGSTNGTVLNGESISLSRLAGNDELRLGDSIFRFVSVVPSPAARGRTILAG